MKKILLTIFILASIALCGCQPKMNLFPDGTDPLLEKKIQGEGEYKVLVISIDGTISDEGKRGLLGSSPSLVQEISSRLKLAAEDEDIKALILKVNSPRRISHRQRHPLQRNHALQGRDRSQGYC